MALTAGEQNRSDGAARVDALEREVTSLRSAAQGVPAAGGAAGAAGGSGAAGLRAEKDLREQVRSLEQELKALRLAPSDGKGAAPTPRQAEEMERAGLESAALKEQVHFHLTECIN